VYGKDGAGGEVRALDGVDLTIRRGETTGLVGELGIELIQHCRDRRACPFERAQLGGRDIIVAQFDSCSESVDFTHLFLQGLVGILLRTVAGRGSSGYWSMVTV
jgi:hypothetical protein